MKRIEVITEDPNEIVYPLFKLELDDREMGLVVEALKFKCGYVSGSMFSKYKKLHDEMLLFHLQEMG